MKVTRRVNGGEPEVLEVEIGFEDEPPCDCGCFWCEEGEHCGDASYESDTGAWVGCLHNPPASNS
jgi:hypothetical protein